MKSIVLLFCFCILFTSCYSYKPIAVAPTTVTPGAKYHFDLKNGKEFVRRIDSISTDGYYITKGRNAKTILFSDVRRLEQGKFSTGRTAGLTGIIAIGATAITLVIILFANWSKGDTNPTN